MYSQVINSNGLKKKKEFKLLISSFCFIFSLSWMLGSVFVPTYVNVCVLFGEGKKYIKKKKHTEDPL